MKIEELMHHCIEEGECILWKRGKTNGHPAIRHNGKSQLVRRVLWESENGEILNGQIITTTCNDVLCINPKHSESVSLKDFCKRMGALGIMSGSVRSAAIQKAKLGKYTKLTAEDVKHIRSSNETTIKLGEVYGVSQAHISKVRKNKTWRDYSSPWIGLLA